MLMMRSDIVLLGDEEVLASIDAYKKSKTFNHSDNLKTNVYVSSGDKKWMG